MTSHYFHYVLEQTNEFHYRRLTQAYSNFLANADKPGAECIKVFSPMSNDILEKLQLVREVSKELQKMKNADMRRSQKRMEDGDSEEESEGSGEESKNN